MCVHLSRWNFEIIDSTHFVSLLCGDMYVHVGITIMCVCFVVRTHGYVHSHIRRHNETYVGVYELFPLHVLVTKREIRHNSEVTRRQSLEK